MKNLDFNDEELNVGPILLSEIFKKPTFHLCQNAGLNGNFIISKILENNDIYYGYDLYTNTFGDLSELGIIDSYTNIMNSIQDSISIGGTLLTTEKVIYNNYFYNESRLDEYRKEIF